MPTGRKEWALPLPKACPESLALGIYEILREAIFKNWPKEFPDQEAFPGGSGLSFFLQLLGMQPNPSSYMHTFLQTGTQPQLLVRGNGHHPKSRCVASLTPFWPKANISDIDTRPGMRHRYYTMLTWEKRK